MFDIGWTELAFLLGLALIVVGPRDLPKLAHAVGAVFNRLRRFYREAMFNIGRLENELNIAALQEDPSKPPHYDLLPEHVKKAMYMTEPSRDADQNRHVQEVYDEAMAPPNTEMDSAAGDEANRSDVTNHADVANHPAAQL